MPTLLTAKQVAEKLNVKTQTVREWFHARKIPGSVLPSGDLRFDPNVIDSWLASRTVKAHKIGRVHT